MAKIAMQPIRGAHRDGSTPGVDRRFTERDLHAYPELHTLAVAYLDDYVGTFEPLLSAQDLLAEAGELPPNIAKLVLNCAYSDPSVKFKIDLDAPSEPTSNVVDFPPQPRTRIQVPIKEEPPVRRHRLRLPAKLKAPYGMSASQGKVLHRVRLHSAYMEWPFEREDYNWRHRIDRDPLPTDKRGTPVLHVDWVCGGSGRKPNPLLFFERPSQVPYCRGGCFSDLCSKCGRLTHLDPNANPEDPIGPCTHCTPRKPPQQPRDERGRFQ